MNEPNKDDEVVIVCMPVGWDEASVHEGSRVIRCSYCERAIWIAPSSQAITYHLALCIPCAGHAIGNDPNPRFGIAPGAIEEVRQHEEKKRE